MRSVTEIQEELALYVTARNKVLEGNQSWGVGDNQYTRADLRALERTIRDLRQELYLAEQLAGGYSTTQAVVFGGRR